MESASTCPRCHVELHSGAASDVVVLLCDRCGGVWLDNPASVRVFQLLDPGTIEAAREADQSARGPSVDLEAAISCPVCRTPMARSQSAAPSVFIDTCHAHGTWLDRNELVAIAQAVAAARGQVVTQEPRPPTTEAGASGGDATAFVAEVGASIGADVAGGLVEGALSLLVGLLG